MLGDLYYDNIKYMLVLITIFITFSMNKLISLKKKNTDNHCATQICSRFFLILFKSYVMLNSYIIKQLNVEVKKNISI